VLSPIFNIEVSRLDLSGGLYNMKFLRHLPTMLVLLCAAAIAAFTEALKFITNARNLYEKSMKE
jgi:hypothetical protein